MLNKFADVQITPSWIQDLEIAVDSANRIAQHVQLDFLAKHVLYPSRQTERVVIAQILII